MTKFLFSLSLLIGISYSSHLRAIEGSYQDAQQVRNSTGKILSSPEFRHLRGFINSKSPLRHPMSKGSGSGSGESGDGSTTGTGNGDQPSSTPSEENPPFTEESSSSANSLSMGGGLGGGLGLIVQFFFWAIIAAVAVAMIYFIVCTFLDRETSSKTEDVTLSQESAQEEESEQAPGEIPADVYITRARELAAQGLYNEAVAQLLLGAMSKIERAGLIQYRRGLTNCDYLRVIRSHTGPHQAFHLIVKTYEPIGFGRRNANKIHFEKSLAGYEQGFRATL